MRTTSLVLLASVAGAVLAAENAKLTFAEQEEFLKTAKIISTKGAKGGITGTVRATLSDGRTTHDASIQSIDEAKSRFEGTRGVEINFRDTYKFNIAGYRLARLLGISTVPPSVERRYQGKSSAFTWWVDDVMMDEAARLKKKDLAPDADAWNEQMHVVRAFDQLIYNTDRNLGNLLITKDWTIWMIDHTRAFRTSRELLTPKNLVKCDRGLLEAMKKMDAATLRNAMAGYITDMELQGLLQRRDKIVKIFESAGPDALFSMTPRQ